MKLFIFTAILFNLFISNGWANGDLSADREGKKSINPIDLVKKELQFLAENNSAEQNPAQRFHQAIAEEIRRLKREISEAEMKLFGWMTSPNQVTNKLSLIHI